MMTASIVRIMLLGDVIAMALLSLIFLRQRQMNWTAYLGWGLLAVLVPVIGPFLVIVNRPGEWDPSLSIKRDVNQILVWIRRLLPDLSRGMRSRVRSGSSADKAG
jgi:hypothetical protein